MNPQVIDINDRRIGKNQPCFIIAEAGVNHNGDIKMAHQLIDVAVAAKVDAVKFQTFQAEQLASSSAPLADYQVQNQVNEATQVEMLRKLELTAEEHKTLKAYAESKGILFLSSPFDSVSVDVLASLNIAAFKIPSGELTNHSLLQQIARQNKPMILSTGMATMKEIEEALQVIYACDNPKVIVLHCVSDYPAAYEEINLRAMRSMREQLQVPIGYSDHTLGIEVALAAVAQQACVIEKHFTLDSSLSGPDHRASLEPDELKKLVRGIRLVESAMGDGIKKPSLKEQQTAAVARKSVVAVRAIEKGSLVTQEALGIRRPGTGLQPDVLPQLIGKRAKQTIQEGALLNWDMLEQ